MSKKKKKPLKSRKQRNKQYHRNTLMLESKLTEDAPVRRPTSTVWLECSTLGARQSRGLLSTRKGMGNGTGGRFLCGFQSSYPGPQKQKLLNCGVGEDS